MSSTLLLTVQLFAIISLNPSIEVIYPRIAGDNQLIHISRVDSNFIFGSVQPENAKLRINGSDVELSENGAFLAFVPLDWSLKRFDLLAVHDGDSSSKKLFFNEYPSQKPAVRPDQSFPLLVELNGGVARTDPRGAYFIFPAKGTVVKSDKWKDGYFRLPLTDDRAVWVQDKYVSKIEDFRPNPPSVLWDGFVESAAGWVDIKLPLGRKVLYRIWEKPGNDEIIVEFYNVISHLDRISYAPGTDLVKEVKWDQPAERVLRLNVSLTQKCWGYKSDWDEGTFTLKLKRQPKFRRGIKGLKIAIDAGHGGDNSGSIGPTGLMEKEINLNISKALAELLTRKGAIVIQTRTDDINLGLYERIEMVETSEADILISIHHNALADGTNPFTELGTSTHYYRSQSLTLARTVQQEIVAQLQLPDEGVYYNNLALVRPTAMPSILIEASYMMLPDQEAAMRTDLYAKKLTKGIFRGLSKFIKDTKKTYN